MFLGREGENVFEAFNSTNLSLQGWDITKARSQRGYTCPAGGIVDKDRPNARLLPCTCGYSHRRLTQALTSNVNSWPRTKRERMRMYGIIHGILTNAYGWVSIPDGDK